VGIGELVGGFCAPAISGVIAQAFGIPYILWDFDRCSDPGVWLFVFVNETISLKKAVTAS